MTSVVKAVEKGAALNARKAKIVCTIGPASGSEAVLRDLMRLGMDVARLNFSHGTHEEHARMIDRLRKVAEKEGRTVCILQDLQGPKIRTGALAGGGPVTLLPGAQLVITTRAVPRAIEYSARARADVTPRCGAMPRYGSTSCDGNGRMACSAAAGVSPSSAARKNVTSAQVCSRSASLGTMWSTTPFGRA